MSFNNPKLYIVSGGPGAGKTTLLLELQKLGYSHAPEAARQIIREQVSAGGTALPWSDRRAYTQLMLEFHRSLSAIHARGADNIFRPWDSGYALLRASHRVS
ncbi:MAG TPA: AAA family ATPase [Bryobacteraceae bacterium]